MVQVSAANATYHEYDAMSRETATVDALANASYYEYDPAGNRTAAVNQEREPTYYYYDQLNRQRAVVDALGNETYFVFDAAGNRTAAVDPRGNAAYYQYDALNRQTAAINAVGKAAYYQYDAVGNRTAVTDPLDKTAYFHYDALGRQTSLLDPLGAATYFEYDPVGNRTVLKDARGNETQYEYDGLNRVISSEDALSQVECYDYDANGNLTASTDPDDLTTYFTYDELNRQTAAVYPDASSRYFAYDAVSNMTRAQDARGWSYFAYDPLNRQTQELAPDAVATYHMYDAVGRRTMVQVSAANATYYEHDAGGRMSSAYNPAVGAAYYQYDANGNRTRAHLAAPGVHAYYTYDDANRLDALDYQGPSGSILSLGYAYDDGSRITSINRQDAGEDDHIIYYAYDAADRLTGEVWRDASTMDSVYAFAWDYDSVGNRTRQEFNGEQTYYEYDAANALTRSHDLDTGWSYYEYDSRGNCTEIQEPDGTNYFEYNHADLVTAIHYKTDVSNYFYYDAQMRRYAIHDSNGLAYFIWDQNGMNLLAERDSAGVLKAEYEHGQTPTDGIGSTAMVRVKNNGGYDIWTSLYDHRGTVLAWRGPSGETAINRFNAWGELLSASGDYPTPDRLGYQTNWLQLNDSPPSLDLYLSPTWMYGATVGRFEQKDMVGSNSRYNLLPSQYQYRSQPSMEDPGGPASSWLTSHGLGPRPGHVVPGSNLITPGLQMMIEEERCKELYPHWWQWPLYLMCVDESIIAHHGLKADSFDRAYRKVCRHVRQVMAQPDMNCLCAAASIADVFNAALPTARPDLKLGIEVFDCCCGILSALAQSCRLGTPDRASLWAHLKFVARSGLVGVDCASMALGLAAGAVSKGGQPVTFLVDAGLDAAGALAQNWLDTGEWTGPQRQCLCDLKHKNVPMIIKEALRDPFVFYTYLVSGHWILH